MEDKSRGLLASIENLNVDRVRPKRPIEDVVGYGWHTPGLCLEERKKVTEQRRDELLECLYQEGLNNDEVEGLVREWLVLLTERDRLFREQHDQENVQEKLVYLRELKQLLRDHPPFTDNSEEMGLREALLLLEDHVTHYCTRHNIASPIPSMAGSKVSRAKSEVKVHASNDNTHLAPSLEEPVNLDHQTGQSRITTTCCVSRQQSEETDTAVDLCNPEPCQNLPYPPLPVKPHNLKEKLTKLSPYKTTPSKTPPQKIVGKSAVSANNVSNEPLLVTEDVSQVNISKTSTGTFKDDKTHSVTPSQLTPPPPPPLPPLLTPSSHKVVGTVQFAIQPQDTTPSNEGEAKDPSLELPNSEERSLLMNEISSVGQTILRRTNRDRSPGGTPLRADKNRLTLTGNTDMLQRALISKFRSFHSTPIKRTGDKMSSIDVSNAWSDVNGSIQVFEDPDITSTSLSQCSPALRLDHNTSSAV